MKRAPYRAPEAASPTCREFLGRRKGYCPIAPSITDEDTGFRYCGRHAVERKLP